MAGEGIELEIYSYANPNQKLDTLEGRVEPKYMEELDDVGAGSFKISRNDPKISANPNLLQGRNVCKYKVDGKVVGAWVLGTRKSTLIDDGEAAGQAYEVAGEGLKTWFNDAIIYPWAGLSHKTRDKRSFSFASPTGAWYKSSQWIEPKASQTWTKTTGNPWKYQPTNWPADLFPHARWVWGTANADKVAPVGTNYFRWTRSFGEARKCSLYIAADNSYQVYLDGEQIAESDPGVSTFYECQKIDFDVDAGDHIIGIAVTNGNAKVNVQHAGLLAGLVYYTNEVPDVNLGNVTVDIGTNARVHRVGHGLANDDKVYLSSTGQLPENLSTNRNYYVADRDANSFALQRTTDGAYIDTEGSQSGVHTLFKAGDAATPRLLSYTGMTDDYTSGGRADALAKQNSLKNKYDALPAGSTEDKATKKQKLQAKNKAAAKVAWQKAVSARKVWDTEVAAVNTTQLWRVNPYPASVPGWSPGEILLTLMAEASARGVRFPSWLTPTFTATKDSNGVDWGDAIEWNFDVGADNLLTVIQKMEELQCSVWIEAATLKLHMAALRGVDHAGDVNAVVFEQGKNIISAATEAKSKMKNALILKTSTGWAATPAFQSASQSQYGTLEDVLNYDGKESVSRQIASQIFSLNATEEEGATYEIVPTDKYPFVDFGVADWVSAPNDKNTNVKRRISSISIEEGDNGIPKYSAEFDTIFHYSEDRINRILQKLGQRGVTGGSGVAAGGQVPASQSSLLLPAPASPLIVPVAPENTVGYAAATWDASGLTIVSEAVVTWDPVDTAVDGSPIYVPGYSVWARQITDADNPNDTDISDWLFWSTSASNMAVLSPFTPGDTWQFMVAAQSPYGSEFIGDFGDVVEVTMGVPTEPLDPPTPPIVDSKLGVAIIRWDGQLKDPLTNSIHGADPRLDHIDVGVSLTPGGPYDYTRGTNITRGGLESYITGYDVGTTIYAVMKAVDGIGIKSDASEEASGIIVGVDLGSLQEDVADAIQQAKDAAVAAEDGVTGKITYANHNPEAADEAGHVLNDLWYKKADGANRIEGIYRFDGTHWVGQDMGGTFITQLDAGNIVTGYLAADRIQVNSLSGTKITAGTLTADKLQANTITTNEIAAGAITTNRLAVGAIDGIVITGAVFRTNNNPSNYGVQMDTQGIRAWQNGQQTLNIGADGSVSLIGQITATSGSFTGTINATGGQISGSLSVTNVLNLGSAGTIRSARADGLTTTISQGIISVSWAGNGSSQIQPNVFFTYDNGGRMARFFTNESGEAQISGDNGTRIQGASGSGLWVGSDGSGGRVWSPDIYPRNYATAIRTGSNNKLMVNTPQGTLGTLSGTIDASYISSSSIRYKHDIEDYHPDLDALLALHTYRFRYNSDNSRHVGMIAEEVAELGLEEFVVRDEAGEIQTIEYVFFSAALLALAQEQERRIARLERMLYK